MRNPGINGGEASVSFVPTTDGKGMEAKPIYDAEVTLGKYVAIKYRLTPSEATTFKKLTLKVAIAGADGKYTGATVTKEKTDEATGEWTVAVVDISSYLNYEAGKKVNVRISLSHRTTLDVAYIVISDNIADIQALLADGETYIDRGTDFSTVGTKYNKDGTVAQ